MSQNFFARFRGTTFRCAPLPASESNIFSPPNTSLTILGCNIYVFNISQTNYTGEPEIQIHEDAQSLLDSIIRDKAIVSSFHPIKASYRPSLHDIIMPSSKQFSTPEEYYSTFFHEIMHWSGKEMNRELNADNKTIAYAKEELIA